MLPKDVQSVIVLCQSQPDDEGLFEALLSLLENASDSAVISTALSALSPDAFLQHGALCDRASVLLKQANADELSDKWRHSPSDNTAQEDEEREVNVIALNRDRDQASQSDYEIVRDASSVKMDDIAGLKDLKTQIHRKIVRPFEDTSLYKKFKRRAGGGLLMYGPPGCGKTMIAKAVAHECKARFFGVHAGEILDKYVGVAEKRIVKLFQEARAAQPSVLLFDEFEALGRRRNYNGAHSESTLISTLLQEMDGAQEENDGLLFLGATNVPWSIDPAFKRPGRFDRTLFVPPPDHVARKYLLRKLLMDRPVAQDIALDKIAERTSGYSGADLEALIETATDYAIDDSESVKEISPISNAHLAAALRDIRPSIGEWLGMAKGFVEYANQDGQYDDLKKFLKKHG